jgi:hypothetical protein
MSAGRILPYVMDTMSYNEHNVREQILERVFPDLRYGGDPDIERYFELRGEGRMLDALAIYRGRLRSRYPDDAKRIVLLKLYRTRSAGFPEFLHGLLMERADDIIARIRRNINALVEPLRGVPMRDTYAVLKVVERVARLLPEDTDAARGFIWSHSDYARLIGYRKPEVDKVSYLLGEFYDQARIEEEIPTDFVAASRESEETRRAEEREKERKNFFDLAKIEFDAADVRRIEIPKGLEREEDKVLAFCHKYWLRVDDQAFERIIWLYSRKYDTRHFSVFRAIKTGRHRKYPDDDVLTTVATIIATRYSYTVQGDLYMQAAWRRIKASLYGQVPVATPLPSSYIRIDTAKKLKTGTHLEVPGNATVADRDKPALKLAKTESRTPSSVPKPAAARIFKVIPASQRKTIAQVPSAQASKSISDSIKKLSGRAYDVYKNIFLSSVRGHIRSALLRSRLKPGGAFNDDTNKAENIVYDFIEHNYSNAYMDWKSSEQRSRILELGFEIGDLEEIIEACYRKIEA